MSWCCCYHLPRFDPSVRWWQCSIFQSYSVIWRSSLAGNLESSGHRYRGWNCWLKTRPHRSGRSFHFLNFGIVIKGQQTRSCKKHASLENFGCQRWHTCLFKFEYLHWLTSSQRIATIWNSGIAMSPNILLLWPRSKKFPTPQKHWGKDLGLNWVDAQMASGSPILRVILHCKCHGIFMTPQLLRRGISLGRTWQRGQHMWEIYGDKIADLARLMFSTINVPAELLL